MGIKKFFKIKPPEEDTVEQNRENLTELGITVKNSNRKKEKFAAYGKFAKDRMNDRFYAPPGYEDYASQQKELDDLNKSPFDESSMMAPPRKDYDPYAVNMNINNKDKSYDSTPYNVSQFNSYNYSTPYDNYQSNSHNIQSHNYPQTKDLSNIINNKQKPSTNVQSVQGATNHLNDQRLPHGRFVSQEKNPNPYANIKNLNSNPYQESDMFDFEGPKFNSESVNDSEIDLNATIKDDNYNVSTVDSQLHSKGYTTFEDIQETQQQEEDDEVDEIKNQIKFTKQSSVASTRNTLKMAQDAEISALNTLGMLGHQSEKLNNVENNLNLMKIQHRVAENKVNELKTLNRNILAVNVSNPFNSKRKAREAEEKIKMQRLQDKMMQQDTNSELFKSTQRIESAMNSNGSDVRDRYQNKQILDRSKRYQFENDDDDDEMEVEIDKNLDKIGQISGRLKKLAIATRDEIDSQQTRIKRIEENTDDMDIKIHLNTTRLTHIR